MTDEKHGNCGEFLLPLVFGAALGCLGNVIAIETCVRPSENRRAKTEIYQKLVERGLGKYELNSRGEAEFVWKEESR